MLVGFQSRLPASPKQMAWLEGCLPFDVAKLSICKIKSNFYVRYYVSYRDVTQKSLFYREKAHCILKSLVAPSIVLVTVVHRFGETLLRVWDWRMNSVVVSPVTALNVREKCERER